MQRGPTGTFVATAIGGERVNAFIPSPLPPDPPLTLSGQEQVGLEAAIAAVGRLDSVVLLLPDPALFLYAYVRKEAVLSSQIEGTQSSLSELLLFEMAEAPGAPMSDVVEVVRYVAAMEHGLSRIRGGFPLTSRLIREIHEVLLSGGRGAERDPGQFRRSQNWIGGTRPGNAVFVPPPANAVADCMADLERFLHQEDSPLPVLLKAGLAHVQFETIHPFLDGNGRVGRLLIALLLSQSGLLKEPLLYLSLYFKRNRARYYELLDEVRRTGDWEAWLTFFLDGVRETAEGAVSTVQRLVRLFEEDERAIRECDRAVGSALRVHQAFRERPILTLRQAASRSGLSFPTATSVMRLLVEQGVAREITGRRRNRVYAYDRYLAILSEGTEPL